jgi:hypothetical protein
MTANCRKYGHDWDIERPSVFSPGYTPPTETIVSTCQRCGTVRTDTPDGGRHYKFPDGRTEAQK